MKDDRVRVDGIELGMSVISDGLKNIKENDQVTVLPDESEMTESEEGES